MNIENKFKDKIISVVGLGYVGLPLALALSKKFKLIGFDINSKRIESLNQGFDFTDELDSKIIESTSMKFTDQKEDIANANIYIVTVPTPVDAQKKPDLTLVKAATSMIANYISYGDCVVYESTVYPGVTEDVCAPILESVSGLKFGKDFHLGYSPERLSPGKYGKKLEEIIKIVSGSDHKTLEMLSEIYSSVVDAGIYKASSIKVAEAAKVLENTQRDLNIALMNELSKICHLLNINTNDVINAAATKWNFMKIYPGLVGGHCIGVDPYYLTHIAKSKGYDSEVILAGRRINNSMSKFVAEQCVKLLSSSNKAPHNSKVLILGLSFKENINDIRNSKVPDVINELKTYQCTTLIFDPLACKDDAKESYGIQLNELNEIKEVDAIICAVNHDEIVNKGIKFWLDMIRGDKIFLDVKSCFKKEVQGSKISNFKYWTL